jgi:hypothetical protein
MGSKKRSRAKSELVTRPTVAGSAVAYGRRRTPDARTEAEPRFQRSSRRSMAGREADRIMAEGWPALPEPAGAHCVLRRRALVVTTPVERPHLGSAASSKST